MMIKKISTPIYNINEEGLFASRDYADGRLIPSITTVPLKMGIGL